jgi:hypothetical protein
MFRLGWPSGESLSHITNFDARSECRYPSPVNRNVRSWPRGPRIGCHWFRVINDKLVRKVDCRAVYRCLEA